MQSAPKDPYDLPQPDGWVKRRDAAHQSHSYPSPAEGLSWMPYSPPFLTASCTPYHPTNPSVPPGLLPFHELHSQYDATRSHFLTTLRLVQGLHFLSPQRRCFRMSQTRQVTLTGIVVRSTPHLSNRGARWP
jgi:hypothetical protein